MPELMLASAEQTEAAGAALAGAIQKIGDAPLCVFLQGELGAGKTTFARGLMRGFGHEGRVPSPTYTLVEPYDLAGRRIWHLDLYRLGDGAELEYLGISEMSEPGSVLLIEWPERGRGFLPDNDLQIILKVISSERTAGRSLAFEAKSEVGQALAERFADAVGALL